MSIPSDDRYAELSKFYLMDKVSLDKMVED